MALSTKYPDVQIELPEGFTPIADDEPVFIVRGQDGLAVAALRGYVTKCAEAGVEQSHLNAVEAELHRWETWQASNPTRIKMPTTARDPDADDDDD